MSEQNVNGTLDARRNARDQEAGLAASGLVGFNSVRPIFEFHAQMLRQWSQLCEISARSAESILQSLSGVIEQDQQGGQQSGRQQGQGRQQPGGQYRD
jgi:hypothetical protein